MTTTAITNSAINDFLLPRRTSALLKTPRVIRDRAKFVDFAPIYAKAQSYIEPLRAQVQIWDLKHLEMPYSYDSFAQSNAITVEGLDVSLGLDTHGSFNVLIYDPERYINSRLLKRKNLVIISAKKYTQEPYTNILYGMQTSCTPIRADTGLLEYEISGIGTGSIINERIINFIKVAMPESLISSNPSMADTSMCANYLFKKLLTDRSIYVVDDQTIAEQLNIDTSLLDSSSVRDILAGINQPYLAAAQVYNAILDSCGAIGGVNANNQAFLNYPSSQHSGITIKSWNYLDDALNKDLAANTSYFMGPFRFKIDWSKENGFTNRWITKGRTQMNTATSGLTGAQTGHVPMFERDLAQKFTLEGGSLRDMAFMLQRIGHGTSEPDRIFYLHGHIVSDNYGFPSGYVIAYIDIPLSDIPTDKLSPVYLNDVNLMYNVDQQQQLWVIFYDRGYNDQNTIHWGVVQNPEQQSVNAVRYYHYNPNDPWVNDHFNGQGWEIHPNSFSFMFSAFDAFSHAIIAQDDESIDRFGLVEDTMTLDWSPNSNMTNQFASERLWWSAMPKVVYDASTVTIPGRLFLPGQIVSIQDEFADLPGNMNISADIMDVHYTFGHSQENALGCQFVDIGPIGYYDFRSDQEEEEEEEDDP